MNYPSIRIEGAILSPDILERIEEAPGQHPVDFGLDATAKVKDEIARAWADAQDYWRIFQRKLETLKADSPATTETRQQWMVPLLGLLGYQLDYQSRGAELNGKIYNISHRATNHAQTPIQIVGYREPAGLDRKPERSTLRMSAHAVVQEFLNLTEQLYGIVTNGRVLRLLRDSSRLIKLSYLEFDLDRIFTDGLFSDFAILYRLLHASRLPVTNDTAAESLIERYHQDSLDSGARIRDGLSRAVEQAIRKFGNGFLAHPANDPLRGAIASGALTPEGYYKNLLRLIYRLLFLMVIEERGLVFPPQATSAQREIYTRYYSVQRLRILSERRYLADHRRFDLWLALTATFRLFEANGPGEKLGIAPLAGDLFRRDSIGILGQCTLGNDVLLGCLRLLSIYEHPDNRQLIRVNYAALNVEEFGSVYEGLLEFQPIFQTEGGRTEFDFASGDERSATGSHYTPDELVQPLIKHSLDYLIAERLKASNPEQALLDLRVADIACGSGHILLAAARRIATELAIVRTGEEQPSPTAFRAALRDVIHECIYGVDLNPLAVELCKVALWLEAHNPGQPLNFLDHHIKCGNAIVGFTHYENVDRGVPDEAFVTKVGDDKRVAAELRKRNKDERKNLDPNQLNAFTDLHQHQLHKILVRWNKLSALPERTPAEIDKKKAEFAAFTSGPDAWLLNQIAAIPIAQFYLPKTPENEAKLITDADFRLYWSGQRHPQGQAPAITMALAHNKRFFHWFLEFPEIMACGGFDCILGNPPYLGGQALSGTYGYPFCEYVKWEYTPAGLSDIVVYFVRRIFSLLKPGGFTALITTNSIKDGDNRRDGLDQVLSGGGTINMAVRGIRWPGRANVVVSLMSLFKGLWSGKRLLDGQDVAVINAYFEDNFDLGEPADLAQNAGKIVQGSIFLGDGFLLTNDEAKRLQSIYLRNGEAIFPVINGKEVNNRPDQAPQRSIINFQDWSLERAKTYPALLDIVESLVKPERETQNDLRARKLWWQFKRPTMELYSAIRPFTRCFVTARVTKHLNFSALPTNYVYLNNLYVFTTDRWDLYSVLQSTLHEVWARKYSMSLKQDLQYSPSDCYVTFAFPDDLMATANSHLAAIGERYHNYRKSMMLSLWLGLTDIYNLFHTRDLTPAKVAKVSKKSPEEAARGYEGLLELRRLHLELDHAIRDAYGWQNLDLGHDFHEVETLPENDRVRYTISPAARKEVLRRLLALNHARAQDETLEAQNAPAKKSSRKASVAATAGAIAPERDVPVPGMDFILLPVDKAVPAGGLEDFIYAVLPRFLAISMQVGIRLAREAALIASDPDALFALLDAEDAAAARRILPRNELICFDRDARRPRLAKICARLEDDGIIAASGMEHYVAGDALRDHLADRDWRIPAFLEVLLPFALKSAQKMEDIRAGHEPAPAGFDVVEQLFAFTGTAD